ncbi:MAG: hypothetical protein IKI50_06785 [Clostridia bacterium]|nr:hypothetical protein [Clostridia bacterium]
MLTDVDWRRVIKVCALSSRQMMRDVFEHSLNGSKTDAAHDPLIAYVLMDEAKTPYAVLFISHFDKANKIAEVSFSSRKQIDETVEDMQLIARCIREICGQVFVHEGAEKVYVIVPIEYRRYTLPFSKARFKNDAILRSHCMSADGKMSDAMVASILRYEFERQERQGVEI